MSGLIRTNEGLRQILEKIADLPFEFLSSAEQTEILEKIHFVFENTLTELEKANLNNTELFSYVQSMVAAAGSDLDEKKFAKNLKFFLSALGRQPESATYLLVRASAEKFFARMDPLLASEEQARKYRDGHAASEIQAHDQDILSKNMQIYAMDYFLFAYENLKKSEDKKEIILSGAGKAPAPAEDALANDMLDKVVYSLVGKDLRRKMIGDYYKYKSAFLPKPTKEDLTEERIKEISEALRIYCLSLIEVSLEYGITELKNSLLEPWGGVKDLEEIKKIISNG